LKHRKVVAPVLNVNPAAAAAAGVQPSTMSEEAQYAQAIVAAIHQGMDGALFAQLIRIQFPQATRDIAALTFDECMQRFKADAQAASILSTVPNFDQFAQQFYAQCRTLEGLA